MIDAGFFGGRAEEVEEEGVFEGVGAVGDVWGEDDGLACGELGFVLIGGAGLAQEEADSAREDEGDLFVVVAVAFDAEALGEEDAGEHHLVGDDALALDEGHGGVGGEIGEGEYAGLHGVSVQRSTPRGCGVLS